DLANARSSQERRNPKADKTRATKSGQINLLLTFPEIVLDSHNFFFHIASIVANPGFEPILQ
ncbi:MAG: hypothetical protein ORO03_06675, partial [Alphaproteobacteria bacterium]|nr:hypothetical protein [Alphaproteobacteria bacterium]